MNIYPRKIKTVKGEIDRVGKKIDEEERRDEEKEEHGRSSRTMLQ